MSKRITVSCLVVYIFLLLACSANAGFVVAAKDSTNRKKADYKCDGKDDQVEIQKAIDKLPETGGAIELLEGTFNFSDCVTITKNNITIKGAGNCTILKHNSTSWVKLMKNGEKGSTTITAENTSQLHVGSLISVTDDDYRSRAIEAGSLSYYLESFTYCDFYIVENIRKNIITLDRPLDIGVSVGKNGRIAPVWVMIKAYGKTNLELRDFEIDCNWKNVVWAIGDQTQPHGKYSHHPGPEPVKPEGYKCPFPQIVKKVHHPDELVSAIYMDSAHNSKFKNLYIHDIPMVGIFLIDSNYVLVEGNTIRNFGLKGYVDCFGDYTQIIGNVVENSLHEDGINVYARGATYAVVSNNIVRNCPRGAIFMNQGTKVTVTGNIVSEGGNGICIISQEAAVTGNYVENSATGIYVRTLAGFWKVQPDDCPITVMGNSVRDCRIGLYVMAACNANLIGNSVAESTMSAVMADAQSNRLIIFNNQLLNTSSGDSPGILIDGKNSLIFGNKIKGFNQGLNLSPSTEENIVERNAFIDVCETIINAGKDNIIEDNI